MRLASIVLALLAALAIACGGSNAIERTATPASTSKAAPASVPSSTGARTPPPIPTSEGTPAEGEVEVTGIVGAVNAGARAIEIDRLSGAEVRKVVLDSAAVVRRAGGATMALAQIKPSDRIVASGRLNEAQDALIATRITVQSVLPGAQPGG